MVHYSKENSIKGIKSMENFNGLMKLHILDNLNKVNYKEKEDLLIKMIDITKDNGKIIWCMGTVNLLGIMVKVLKEIILMIKNKDKEY